MQLRRKILILLYAVLATAPVAAMVFHVRDHQLDGTFAPAPRPPVTFDGIRSEAFQTRTTAWFEGGLGLRGYAAWLDNTLLYHALRETKYGSLVEIGEDRVLFERDDIEFFNRSDDALPAPGAVAQLADDIAELQRLLAAQHRALVPLFIPSKTTFYRDEVPARWTRDLGDPRPAQITVIAALKTELDRRQVRYADAIAFLGASKLPRAQLWGRDARHYSTLASCLCNAAILDAYGALVGKPEAPYRCDVKEIALKRGHSDLDLFRLLNAAGATRARVAWEVVHEPVPPQAVGPNALWISSSFGWLMRFDAASSHRFAKLALDYYNRTYDQVGGPSGMEVVAHTPAWREAFLGRDLYVLELNESYVTPGSFFGGDAIHAILEELRKR